MTLISARFVETENDLTDVSSSEETSKFSEISVTFTVSTNLAEITLYMNIFLKVTLGQQINR